MPEPLPRFEIRFCPASIPIRPSCASATTTTSPPRRSSGIPGVQIHHSRDLVHWRLLTRPLNRASQLNMLGDPDSCGIWAPCLTHADGLFWLIYTDVKRYGRTTQAGAQRRVAARLPQLSRHQRAHRRRLVRPGLSQQQRLRSVAVSRRRRPQISGQHALGSSARAAIGSPASCCRNIRRRSAS